MSERHTKLWIVGRTHPETQNEEKMQVAWEFQGVFEEKADAVAACEDETYFIGPCNLNTPLPRESCQWDGAIFPSNRSP